MSQPQIASVEDLLKMEEGCCLSPYRCPAGKLTIGYGHNLDARPISIDDAVHILETDIHDSALDAEAIVGTQAFLGLDEVRRAVLTSMAFQMGQANLFSFKATLACVRDGEYEAASRHMLRSKWAKQTPARAKRHAHMMLTGQWPKAEDYD